MQYVHTCMTDRHVYILCGTACGVSDSTCMYVYCVLCCPAAELEKKVYDLKRYIKTLHETVPSMGNIPMPTSPATSRPTSAEVPSWVAKDLSLEIKPMVLVRPVEEACLTGLHHRVLL